MIIRFSVVYRPEAQADIEDLYFSVLSVSQSFEIADRFVDSLRDRCQRIGNAPFGGRTCGPPQKALRMVPFGRSVIIVYRVLEDRVVIINLFPSRRDYQRILDNFTD